MGTSSKYLAGKFYLYVMFYRPTLKKPSKKAPAPPDPWPEAARKACLEVFNKASELLYAATNGRLQIGEVLEVTTDPDAIIYKEDGVCMSPFGACLRETGYMLLYEPRLQLWNSDRILLHELGHFCLGLYDEYEYELPSGDQVAFCVHPTLPARQTSIQRKTCIMERDDDANIFRFCEPGVHQTAHPPGNPSRQQIYNRQSCWEHLSKNYGFGCILPAGITDADMPLERTHPELVYPPNPHPAEGLEKSEKPPVVQDYQPPVFKVLPTESRFALLLDRSVSLTPALWNGLRIGAHFWTNLLAQSCERLALVAYNQEPEALWPLSTVSELQVPLIEERLAAVTPQGLTNLEGALRAGLAEIVSPGYQASTQKIFLVTDGVHNTGELTAERVDELVMELTQAGIQCHTLGVGPYADQRLLQRLAAGTAGRFEHLPVSPEDPLSQWYIQNAFMTLAGQLREGSGLAALVEQPAPLPGGGPPSGSAWEYPVALEEGALQATFLVSYVAGDALQVTLRRPDGVRIDPKEHRNVKWRHPADAPYAFYLVEDPMPGTWIVQVTRLPEFPELPFTVMVFSNNPEITAGVNLSRRLFPVDADIPIKAGAAYQYLPLPFKEPPKALVQREIVPGGVGWEAVALQPVVGPVAKPGMDAPLGEPTGLGVFSGVVRSSLPGAYPLRVEFPYHRGAAPAFTRVVLRQIPVGPLPAGKDVEH
ncbi:MAG: VWA domain-containing protein [Deltaproteobacteria bacterium]|nr:VWA domain-containing protein [Deltaproteobacteria bacterium]